MKKTQLKDSVRNIRKQVVSYLSIVVIAALGVVMFLGIDYSASAMRRNGSDFYNAANYRDIDVISTLMFSGEDLDLLRGIEGVKDVEGIMQAGIKVIYGGVIKDAYAVTAPKRINAIEILEGRLPESADECAAEKKLMDELGLRTGDSISVRIAASDFSLYLSEMQLKITGVVAHPDHISTSAPDNPYIIIPHEIFDNEALAGSFMRAEIVIDKPSGINRFEDDYREMSARVIERINALAGTRAPIRDAEVSEMAEEFLSENRDNLADAWAKLEDARKQLDDGWAEYFDGEEKLREGEEKLNEARRELDAAKAELEEGAAVLADSRSQLDDAKAQLEAAKAELDEAKARLDKAKRQLTDGWNEIEDAKAEIRDAIREELDKIIRGDSSEFINWAGRQEADVDSADASAMNFAVAGSFSVDLGSSLKERIRNIVERVDIPEKYLIAAFDGLGGEGEYSAAAAKELIITSLSSALDVWFDDYSKLSDACRRWDEGHGEYISGTKQYQAGLSKYNAALARYNDGEAQYAEGLAKYEEGLREYNEGEAQYAEGLVELEDARKQLADGLIKLNDSEAEYSRGVESYNEASAKVNDAERIVSGIDRCKWMALDTYGNSSFVQFAYSAQNLKSLEMTFSLLFVMVGALVIYATISKMVDEQRNLVGTTKALGFYNREIFAKYLMFGVSAAVLGAIIGMIMARFFVEGFILNGYGIYYTFDLRKPVLKIVPTAIVFAAAALLAAAAIWMACSRLLKTPAVKLMQQAAPKGRTKSGSGSKDGQSLYSRLILLNMKTDIKRVLVTIVSVAGCCTLIVIGFTLRHAVKGAVTRHFTDVVQYDGLVKYDPAAGTDVGGEVGDALRSAGVTAVPVMNSFITVKINNIEVDSLYCGDLTGIGELFRLNDVKTGKSLAPSDDGIFVMKRFAETNKLSAGDRIKIALNGTEEVETTIAGVFNCYMDRTVFMSGECFKRLFMRDMEPNAYMVRLSGADGDALLETLGKIKGFESWSPADSFKKLFASATKVINAVVALFILMAAIMAGVVLMNLTNIYIMQKKRELTIMRVNGFTVRETVNYVLRETVITTVVGIILGIALGSAMAYFIVRALEQPFIQFDRSVCFFGWLAGAVITVVFTVIINAISLRKVRNLKLTDVA